MTVAKRLLLCSFEATPDSGRTAHDEQRAVSPYNVALIYAGLGDRKETLAWLERGIEQRDPKMVILDVDPKWKSLRDDPRFQDLLRRVGF